MSNGEFEDNALLARLRARGRGPRTKTCPDEERLRFFAVGLTDTSESQELLEHATACDYCGPLLREAVQDLGAAPSEEEIEFAGKTRLSNLHQRQAFAKRLAGGHRWFLRVPRPVIWLAPATAVAGLAVLTFQSQWIALRMAERHTNHAYTEHRTLAMRFPGASYGPLQGVEMGGETSGLNKPAEFYEAKAAIGRGLEAHPNDPRWLRLQGESDLLENRLDPAISGLEHARALRPQDPYILSDLGVAYYQKAQNGDTPYYLKAFQVISDALRLKPDDPVLLFNRALAAGHLQNTNAEREAWNSYLQVDSTSGWAAEARQHLQQAK
jgi:hypothetical protein